MIFFCIFRRETGMPVIQGEMQEWLIWHAWKACVPRNGTGGSNPPFSALTVNQRDIVSQTGNVCRNISGYKLKN